MKGVKYVQCFSLKLSARFGARALNLNIKAETPRLLDGSPFDRRHDQDFTAQLSNPISLRTPCNPEEPPVFP
jgi:hypothetical protein